MAKGIALAVILIAIAATYWRPLRRVRSALGVDYLLSTGHGFLVLGYFVGLTFGEQARPLTVELSPIVALVAGWVGFAAGMRFDLRVLRTIPTRALVVALMPGFAAAAVVGIAGGAVLLWSGIGSENAILCMLILGATAASSGPTLIAMIRGRRAGRLAEARPVLRLAELSAGVDDIVVVVFALLAFSLFRTGPEPIAPPWFIGITVGGGVLLGWVTWLFLGGQASRGERLLLGLAMLVFTAGFAGWLLFSPAAVAAIMAMVLVNLPGDRMTQLVEAVRKVERPAVVILMTVIGFHIADTLDWTLWPLVAVMTVGRIAAKRLSGSAARRIFRPTRGLSISRSWGYSLAPQGVIGLSVALSFFHVWRDDIARTVLAAAAVSAIVNELVAPWFLLRMLNGIPDETSRDAPPQGDRA